jgi:hypothetical protein
MKKKYDFYAQGGSLGNHGLKQGDQIIKTMSGGVQKVKTKSGDIVYVNLANGYRGAEPPLPFKNGGAVKKNLIRDRKFVNYSQDYEVRYSKDKPKRHGYTKPKMSRTQFEDESFEFFADGGLVGREVTFMSQGEKDKGIIGEVNEDGSLAVDTGRSLRLVEKDEIVEIHDKPKKRGFFFADGGEIRRFNRHEQMDSETREEILDVVSEPNTPRGLVNYLYGLFDGYDYSKTANFKKEMEVLKSKDSKLHDRVIEIYKKIDNYKFEKYEDNYATGGGVDGNKYLTIYKDEWGSEKTEFDNYSDALEDYNDFASDDANISLYEIINGQKKLLKKNVSSANIEYVELSNGDIVVALEKIDGKWEEREVLEGETPYGWGGKRYMSYLKPKDLAQWLSKDYGGDFKIVEQYAKGGVTKNYINRNQLNTITIKKGDQKLTYKVSDVYNGGYKLEDGGNLEKMAFYVAKRNVVKVQLKNGKDVKVANGYWIKKGAKPIHTSKYDDGGQLEMKFAGGGKIETKIQKKVDEVNALIEKAIDSDGDPLMVVDTTGTWEEPMQYKPIVYKNGRLYIEYFEPYSGKTEKDVINKSNVDFDGYPTLLNIAKMYRKALKEKGISYADGGSVSKIYVVEYEVNGNKKKSEYLLYENDKVEKMLPSNAKIISIKQKMATGGKTTFKEKATAIAKNFEGKKVKPKYQKEYGKTYDKAEAKEVGNKIAGSQKAKYDSKMSDGGISNKLTLYKSNYLSTANKQVLTSKDGKDIYIYENEILYDSPDGKTKGASHRMSKLELNILPFTKLSNQKMATGGNIAKKYNALSKEDKEELMREKVGIGRTPFSEYEKYSQLSSYHKEMVDKHLSIKKMATGGKTKRGGAMVLAKQIRKDGESWASALKRANEQMRKK